MEICSGRPPKTSGCCARSGTRNKTLKNLKGAWVKDQDVKIEKGKVTGYKVILKVTFILQD